MKLAAAALSIDLLLKLVTSMLALCPTHVMKVVVTPADLRQHSWCKVVDKFAACVNVVDASVYPPRVRMSLATADHV